MAEKIDYQNPNRIIVDDGYVTVPIYNKIGNEIGVFKFNPSDVGIIDRFNSMAAEFDKIVEPLENVNIAPDGTADGDVGLDALHEAEQRLYAACDKLFGGNMSEAFFGTVHPFSPINGHFYCENALAAVGAYISRQFGREVQKINSRVEKYIHGYRTGKHKGGKAKGGKK